MFVGVSRIELHISGATSLKEKRQVMKSLAQRIGHRFNVSVAETDHQDLYQRGTLSVAHVSISQHEVEKVLQKIADFSEANANAEVIRCTHSFFNPDKDYLDE